MGLHDIIRDLKADVDSYQVELNRRIKLDCELIPEMTAVEIENLFLDAVKLESEDKKEE